MNDKSEFEKVIQGLGYVPAWDGDQYLYEEVEVAWQAWQAARAQGGEAVADEARKLIQIVLDRADQWERGEKLPEDHDAWIFRAKALLSSPAPQPEGDGWIKCSERLPTEADADEYGEVWANDKAMSHPRYKISRWKWDSLKEISDLTHWMPTGLKRPQPPQEQ